MFMYKTSLDCLPLELERNTEEGDGMDICELSAGCPPTWSHFIFTVRGGDSPSPTTEELHWRACPRLHWEQAPDWKISIKKFLILKATISLILSFSERSGYLYTCKLMQVGYFSEFYQTNSCRWYWNPDLSNLRASPACYSIPPLQLPFSLNPGSESQLSELWQCLYMAGCSLMS